MNQFDVPTTTPLKSIMFFNKVFGWTFQPGTKHNNWTAKITSKEYNLRSNPFIKQDKTDWSLTNAITVKNIDETLRQIQKEGGEVIIQKFSVPEIGWMAYFKDLEQNVFGIYQAK